MFGILEILVTVIMATVYEQLLVFSLYIDVITVTEHIFKRFSFMVDNTRMSLVGLSSPTREDFHIHFDLLKPLQFMCLLLSFS